MSKTLQNAEGSISITRPSYGDEREFIEIALTDKLSGSEFCSVRILLDDFARALTGLGHVACRFDFHPAVVGMKYEHKTERVKRPTDYVERGADRERVAREAFAPFEVDGWRGRVDDLFNSHRHAGDGSMVTFTRHVPVEESETK